MIKNKYKTSSFKRLFCVWIVLFFVFGTFGQGNEKKLLQADELMNQAVELVRDETAEARRTALQKLFHAKTLYQEMGLKEKVLSCLVYAGIVYDEFGESQKALDYSNQALIIAKEENSKIYESTILSSIGKIYSELGEYEKSLIFYRQALQISELIGNKGGEALNLTSIGRVLSSLGKKKEALGYLNRSLDISRAINDKTFEASNLLYIGSVFSDLESYQEALHYYLNALVYFRQAARKRGEAMALNAIASTYFFLGEERASLEYFFQSTSLYAEIGLRRGEALNLHAIAIVWATLKNRRLAIFFNKQSINRYQQVRGLNRQLDNETQKSLLRTAKNSYQFLAELLLEDNQPEQAVQVLNLYQDQQFLDFSPDDNAPVLQVVLSPREKMFADLYEEMSRKVRQISLQSENLRRQIDTRQPNDQERNQLQKLENDLSTASQSFTDLIKNLEVEFTKPDGEQAKSPSPRDVVEMQGTLRELGTITSQKTAALYTLIGRSSFYLVLITPDEKAKVFASPIVNEEFKGKIVQFYALLSSNVYDPRILGKELYDIILKPAEGELKRQNIQNLMWSLDDSLRYIPVAALWDGEKYLVEKYQNIVFTRANRERLTRKVSPIWTGTGFGNSKAQTVDWLGRKVFFRELPSVGEELSIIFRTGGNRQSADSGLITGDVFIDNQFTRESLFAALKKNRPLVHISTHFSFRPGDEMRSFLLLGNGEILSLGEMREQRNLFQGVELLTLSACDTAAIQPDTNGREIDGFAELAQRLGAGAVIATLWKVTEKSTAQIMGKFYKNQQVKRLTKAQSLRQAQLDLLYEKSGEKTASLNNYSRKSSSDSVPQDILIEKKYRVPFDKNQKGNFTHPYFWAPFVLFGNWK